MSLNKIDIHIVSFDVPLPANYGGVIDVFSRIKTLHQHGVKIALHCFDYGRGKQKEIDEFCAEVYYYKRNLSLFNLFSRLPFIVLSRKNPKLLDNLLRNNAPILFEGHHSCYYLDNSRLESREKWVRTHNVEHHYYDALAAISSDFFKKNYYKAEAKKLLNFQVKLKHAQKLFSISKNDTDFYKKINSGTYHLNPFHLFKLDTSERQIENFALYQGNLAVEENIVAVKFLISVFSKLDVRLVLSGRKPVKEIINLVSKYKNIQLIANPNEATVAKLIKAAKINCLYTEQSTGVKLKLIRALIEGNIVIVNAKMIEGTDLAFYCEKAEIISEWREKIQAHMNSSINVQQLLKYRKQVADLYNNDRSVEPILKLLKQ